MAEITLAALLLASDPAPAQEPLRGDVNSDGKVDIGDPIFLLNHLFSGGNAPECSPSANANGDASLDISDAIAILTYLFVGPGTLEPLTAEELAQCKPAGAVVRHGKLHDKLDPGHGIDGAVKQLSSGSVRIEHFYFDGLGLPKVVILLTKASGFDNVGIQISQDLVRDHPYVDETLEYPLPPGVTSDDFKFVAIWCDAVPLTYGFAFLLDGP